MGSQDHIAAVWDVAFGTSDDELAYVLALYWHRLLWDKTFMQALLVTDKWLCSKPQNAVFWHPAMP